MMDQARERFYGRRKGRPLRSGRQHLIDELLPRLVVKLGGKEAARSDWADGKPDRMVLEVGFGAGEHLAAMAKAEPDTGFIGCEPFVNGVARLLSRIDEDHLDNVRIWPDDARPLIDALPEASFDAVYVLFPDPWPKRRHWERRFVGPRNLPRLARIIKPGGALCLASDHADYIAWMLFHVRADRRFRWIARHPDDWRLRPADWPQTRYDAKARSQGLKPAYLRFQRV